MKREPKKEMKEIEKNIKIYMKKLSKENGFKIISNSLYKKEGDFFVHGIFFIRFDKDKFKIIARMNAKPYKSDELFWNIFDMQDNINGAESLKATGAFVAPSVQFTEISYELSSTQTLEYVCKLVIEKLAEESEQYVQSVNNNIENYIEYVSKLPCVMHKMLLKMLVAIQLGDYQLALKMAQDEVKEGKNGCFENKGKDIYEYIVDYCQKKC